MRELILNGYIDDECWFGDEITPQLLHEQLYGEDELLTDDVHIRLNSFGGSCNAAVRMYDDIRAYPGFVKITISGTAASAATMLCMAADRLEMTPGSLFMIHDPSMVAYGNESDMRQAIDLLRACKDSILNMYASRIRISREDAADMMTVTSWMDAREAFDKGFVDEITVTPDKLPTDSIEQIVSIDVAKAGVQAFYDRKTRPFRPRDSQPQAVPAPVADNIAPSHNVQIKCDVNNTESNDRVMIRATDTRLEYLRY